ncbi:MAG: zinc ribbon domain-containing protein [Desulfuromonadales bacterium]|nr:zinc ribbon domain-containing protein [Desulfuromonadales bacterium]NIR33068.1 zinc ribbon domain-containing protein [Desulfuromonadales bacterium]NIS39306.1 zinc ribbon domain-containing protein [Desulfuromonadales bacterium]
MPLFEYRCASCDATTEKIQSRPVEQIDCPKCGKKAKKAVSLFAASSGSSGACSAPTGSGFG